MITINVANFLQSAFSNDQAEMLKGKIEEALNKEEKITIDFKGITKFTTLFFNFSTGYFITTLGKKKYDDIFQVVNLNELGQSTYNHSYNNCIRDEQSGNSDILSKIRDIIEGMDDL